MTEPVRYGILGCANIAVEKVIPGIQASDSSRVEAIASRSADRARAAAQGLGIPVWHGSYQDLLEDPRIEAIYIPLPNHLHEEWAVAAAAAGKHVLCEKPLATSSAAARRMVAAADGAGVSLMEAFMYRFHPMWHLVRQMVGEGRIGDLMAIQSIFSYRNLDPGNIRNIPEFGGGALYDIGCYAVNVARMMFGSEPDEVKAVVRRDSDLGTDVVTSAVLDFGGRHAGFTVSTQVEDSQSVHLVGTAGRLVMEIPFNIPPDRPTTVSLFAGGDPPVAPHVERFQVEAADQYGLQADAFSRAIRERSPVPLDPRDAVANLEVLERIFRDAGL